MLHSLDIGRNSEKFRFFSRRSWHNVVVPECWREEAAILLATPGFLLKHHAVVFGWAPYEVPDVGEAAEGAGHANAMSVSFADSDLYLWALLGKRPRYCGSVPFHVKMMLLGLGGNKAVVERYGVSRQTASDWRNDKTFDPLTLLPKSRAPRENVFG